MKKVLKNRIFLCAIVGICCLGIGVYGATKYQASEILFNPSNGDSMTVNEALNDLYNNSKTTTTKCSILCGNARIGDYVKMTPTSTSYTISKDLTGYSDDQTINPSELNLWRIIKINEDGTIEMISENVSSTKIYFTGKTGYLNLVGALNEIASQYGNSKYTINSRIIGYGGQTEYLTDTSKFTTTAPWTSSTTNNNNETLGGGDIMYEADTNSIKKTLGTLKTTTSAGAEARYWLGSRIYLYGNATYYYWRGRLVNTNGDIDCDYLYNHGSGWVIDYTSAAIRPILTLKSGLTAKGTGTKEDPWVLE